MIGHAVRMVLRPVLVIVLVGAQSALARQIAGQPIVSDWGTFHRKNDEYWARFLTATTGWRDAQRRDKVRLSADDIRKIRLAAGIADNEPSDSIINLLGVGPDQFLLVTAKPGGCLNLGIYLQDFRHVQQVWFADSLPDGESVCHQPGCRDPVVQVNDKHEVYISLFMRSNPREPTCDEKRVVSYIPKASSFAFAHDETKPLPCFEGDYSAAYATAIRRAAGQGEIFAIVTDWIALSSQTSAVVFQRGSTGVRVLRMQFSSQPLDYRRSTDECYSQLATTPIRVKEKHISQDQAQNLLKELRPVDLKSDRCPRAPDTSCVVFTDGRAIEVQVGEGSPVWLTDVSGYSGYVSENPALSKWALHVLHETR